MTTSIRLTDCGDTLSIAEICGVLGMSQREFYRRRAHGAFPIQPLRGMPNRFSKTAVQKYLDQSAPTLSFRKAG